MIFPEKIARWCSPGMAPAPAGASAPGGSFPARSPGLLFRVRVLVGGRAALIEGLGESLGRLLGLELREPFELSVLVRSSCSSSLFSGTFSLIGLPRAILLNLACACLTSVLLDIFVLLVELGLIPLLGIALLDRFLCGIVRVDLRSRAGELVIPAEFGEEALALRVEGAI